MQQSLEGIHPGYACQIKLRSIHQELGCRKTLCTNGVHFAKFTYNTTQEDTSRTTPRFLISTSGTVDIKRVGARTPLRARQPALGHHRGTIHDDDREQNWCPVTTGL